MALNCRSAALADIRVSRCKHNMAAYLDRNFKHALVFSYTRKAVGLILQLRSYLPWLLFPSIVLIVSNTYLSHGLNEVYIDVYGPDT